MNEDFESYSIEDEEDELPVKRLTMWTIVPQIMVTPASGWAKAEKNGPSPELAVIRFFLPLCLLSGGAAFISLLYPHHVEGNVFTTTLVNAVIQFCSFFIGYYVALVATKGFLPKEDRRLPSTSYGKLMIMTGVATLALFHILFLALPMLDFILGFLPLWTIFLLFKGMERVDIRSDKRILCIAVVCLATIGSPTLMEWILTLFA